MTVITATTQLPADWAGLLKGYLYYVTKSYGGPAMQNFVLGGPLLSANAGGYIAKRNVHDWLYGAAMSHAACIWCSSHRSGLPSIFLVAQQRAYWVLHDVQHISAQGASVIPCRVGGPAAGVGRRVQRLPSSQDVAHVCMGDARGANAGDTSLVWYCT